MSEAVVPLEVAEVGAFVDLYRAAPAEVVERCGIVVSELGEGFVLAATRLDVLALNRAFGFGLEGPMAEDELVRILDAFAAIGSPRFFLQLPPVEGSDETRARAAELGLRHYNNWMRLSRTLDDLPQPPPTELVVRRLEPDRSDTFSRIVADAFGYPPEAASLTGCPIGRPGWRHYLAYEDGEAIAGAAMFVAGEAAWLGFAGTAAERRGRGAQTALVVSRLHDAAAEGCTWVSVETAEQTPEREAPSFRNLRRLGFEVAYTRPNYLWTREQT